MRVIFSFLLLVAVASAVNYCSICKDHTLCKYTGPNCPGLKYKGVTKQSDKQAVVDAHNKYRSIVALGQEKLGHDPPAANMRKLEWDDELAAVAQRWAEQCTFEHDSCRNVERFYVGQNIYEDSTWGVPETDTQDWEKAVKDWYDEIVLVTPALIKSFRGGDWGHYTQVVWAETQKVGCGFVAYKGDDDWFNKFYVCNYGPGGNIKGQKVYEVGPACSKCPSGTTCSNGLCA